MYTFDYNSLTFLVSSLKPNNVQPILRILATETVPAVSYMD